MDTITEDESIARKEGIDDTTHLSRFQTYAVLAALVFAQVATGFDAIVVGSLVPTLETEFNSVADVGWYGSVYIVLIGATAPTFGKAFTVLPTKTVFLTAVALFELGSAVCATANSPEIFIIGRALNGLGASGILSGSQVIMTRITPLHLRPIVFGIVGAGEFIGVVLGPALGGVLIQHFGWRWCFWVNLPFGALLAISIFRWYKDSRIRTSLQNATIRTKLAALDLSGGVLLTGSAVCLMVTLELSGRVQSAWSSMQVMIPGVAFIFLFAGAVFVQHRKKEGATIPTRLFGNRAFVMCLLFEIFAGGAQLDLYYYLPSWIQGIAGRTPDESGVMIMPASVSSLIGTVASIGFSFLTNSLPPSAFIGITMMCVASGLMSSLKPHTPTGQWVAYEIFFGFGCGMMVQMGPIGVQTALEEADIPIGLTTTTVGRHVGGAVFMSISQTLFLKALKPLSQLIPGFDALSRSGATIGQDYLRKMVDGQKFEAALGFYNNALTRSFLVPVVLSCLAFLCLTFIPWMPLKRAKREEAMGYHEMEPFVLDEEMGGMSSEDEDLQDGGGKSA